MTIKIPAACLVLVTALAGITRPLPAVEPVAVSTTASVDYVQQKFAPDATKRETYLFFQGKFYGGTTKDSDLEQAQFDGIAKILAENMVHQNYFPSKDPKDADLLIVVHWGVTTVYDNPNQQEDLTRLNSALAKFNAAVSAGKKPDPGPVNQAQAIVDAEQVEVRKHISENSVLLGFSQQFAKDQSKMSDASSATGTDRGSLLLALSEERYFVILMAYDYHTMKKGSTPKLLWSTRFSISANGNSFTRSLPIMSRVAADYFGHAVDGLKIEKPNVPEGKVEVGEPTVVGDGKGK
jgi:hypothetical protein